MLPSFVGALKNLAPEVKAQMQAQFFEEENSINSKLSRLIVSLNEVQSNRETTFHFEDEFCRDDSKEGMPQSKQFLQMQKKREVKNYNLGVNFVDM